MLSNRESARRSRRRKQAHLGHLQLKVNQLQCENQDLLHKLHQLHGSFNTMMERNRMIKDNMAFLRMQIMSGKPLSREALAAVTQAVAVGEQTNLQAHLNSTLFGPNGATTPMMMQPNGQSMGVPYTSASMGAMGGMMQGGMQGGMVPGPHGGMGGPVGQMGQMRVNSPAGLTPYQMSQMNQTMNHPSQHMTQNMGTYNGMNGLGGQNMANSNGMNGLGNFKLEPQQPGASAGVSEFSNGSSLTHAQGGSMGNGMNTMGGTPNEHPGPKGGSMSELNKMNGGGASVHETDDGQHGYIHGDGRFIEGPALAAAGQIAEREAALAAAVAAQLQMSTQMANDNGVDTAGLGLGDVIADQEAALAAQLNARSPAPNDDGRSNPSGEGFQLPAAAAAAGLAAAQAAAQGRNGRQASDGSCADARRKQRAGSGDSSDARAGGGGGETAAEEETAAAASTAATAGTPTTTPAVSSSSRAFSTQQGWTTRHPRSRPQSPSSRTSCTTASTRVTGTLCSSISSRRRLTRWGDPTTASTVGANPPRTGPPRSSPTARRRVGRSGRTGEPRA